MKTITLSLIMIFLSIGAVNAQKTTDLSGTWKLEIDKNLDRTAIGNLGCPELKITTIDTTHFSAQYQKCNVRMNFYGIISASKRGQLISISANHTESNFNANLSGYLTTQNEKQIIEGVWITMDGTRGDFKLTKK